MGNSLYFIFCFALKFSSNRLWQQNVWLIGRFVKNREAYKKEDIWNPVSCHRPFTPSSALNADATRMLIGEQLLQSVSEAINRQQTRGSNAVVETMTKNWSWLLREVLYKFRSKINDMLFRSVGRFLMTHWSSDRVLKSDPNWLISWQWVRYLRRIGDIASARLCHTRRTLECHERMSTLLSISSVTLPLDADLILILNFD